MIKFETGIAGRYMIEKGKMDSEGNVISKEVVAPWFTNLIVDGGMDEFGRTAGGNTFTWLNACWVGTGNTPPAVTDTALASFLAANSDVQAQSEGGSGGAPWYVRRTVTYRFDPGVATGNLSEVAIATGDTPGVDPMFSRALIVDGGGVPTTISVLADEFLDVTYEFRVYAPAVDVVGTVNISGVDYDYTVRASRVNNIGSSTGWRIGLAQGTGAKGGAWDQSGATVHAAWAGPIGLVTAAPTGTSSAVSTMVNAAYTNGNYYRDGELTFGISSGNVGGIMSVTTSFYSGYYQTGFVPVIPKINTQTLTLTYRNSWVRAVI